MSATAVRSDLAELAPNFRRAVEAALAECHAAGLDVVVFEALRTPERQAWLYEQGRTRPGAIITNVRDAKQGWHFYGLAVDVISKSRQWDQPRAWWDAVGRIFERHGCTWGGRWKFVDLPHIQWGKCATSPNQAPVLYAQGGVQAVWRAVGAGVLPPAAPIPTIAAPAAPVLPEVEPKVVGGPAAPELRLEPIAVPTATDIEKATRLLGLDERAVCQGGAALLAVLKAMAPGGVTGQLIDALDGYRARRCG